MLPISFMHCQVTDSILAAEDAESLVNYLHIYSTALKLAHIML